MFYKKFRRKDCVKVRGQFWGQVAFKMLCTLVEVFS